MSEPTGQSIREVFLEAAEIVDPAARTAFLDRSCGATGALRDRVNALLAADAAAGPPETEDDDNPLPPSEGPGSRIGRYKLIQQLGEGGYGTVFMAEQEEPVRRHVAIKLVKLGLDTRQVVARFNAERQALALMDHPHIAKVLDAGATESGRPYFVMELVRGTKITKYCEQHHFSVRRRLELFILVCQAVQHAHQKGIIHRDLKPSNILVTETDGVAVPKVIDFGIAKAIESRLTDQTRFTAFDQFLGTPAYMSPEQAAMTSQDIDTRSDIYSLGVLLYELLTGRPPFETRELLASGLDAMRQTIREREPLWPSTRLNQELTPGSSCGAARRLGQVELRRFIQLVRGDLDWIVMKCLAKERGRRYETANALAMDLKRHLGNEPVLARPPSRLYEFQRTVRRHKLGFAATAAVIVALAGGLVMSHWEAGRARRAEWRAEFHAARQQQTAYDARMREAGEALRGGDLGRVREILRRYMPAHGEPDLRGWEWRHLAWESRGDEHISLIAHSNRLASVKFLDDRTLLSVGHGDKLAIEWDLPEKRARLRLTNDFQPSSVAILPAERRIYYIYWPPFSDQVRTLDLGSQVESTALFESPTNFPEVHGIAASADGQLLAVQRAHCVNILDRRHHTSLGAIALGDVTPTAAALSPDGMMIAVGDDHGGLVWWDVQQRRPVGTNQTQSVFRQLAFSPTGDRLAAVEDDGLALYRRENRTVAWERAELGLSGAVAWHPSGRQLALAARGPEIHLIEAESGRVTRTLRGHTDQIQSLDFSPDGTRLASGSRDGELKVWDLATPPAVSASRAREEPFVGFAADGSAFYTAAREQWETVELWSSRTLGKLGEIQRGELQAPVGVLLPGGRTVALVDTADGALLLRGAVDQRAHAGHAAGMTIVAASADGRVFVTHPWGNPCLNHYRLPTLELVSCHLLDSLPGGTYMSVTLAPLGQRLAAATGTGQLDVWEVEGWKKLWSAQFLSPVENSSFAFAPDGRHLVVTTANAPAVILDLDSPARSFLRLSLPPGDWPKAYSADGRRLAVGVEDGIRLLATESGEELLKLPIREARALAFSPDGEFLTVIDRKRVTALRAPPVEDLTFEWLKR